MSLASNLIFLVIFGIAGLAIDKYFDFNPAEYWSRFGTASIMISLAIVYLPAIFNPEDVVGNVERITNWFVAVLPGVIIGDAAGEIISNITGREGRR